MGRFIDLGEKKTVQEWSKELGISKNTIYGRYFRGFKPEEIFYKGNLKNKDLKGEDN